MIVDKWIYIIQQFTALHSLRHTWKARQHPHKKIHIFFALLRPATGWQWHLIITSTRSENPLCSNIITGKRKKKSHLHRLCEVMLLTTLLYLYPHRCRQCHLTFSLSKIQATTTPHSCRFFYQELWNEYTDVSLHLDSDDLPHLNAIQLQALCIKNRSFSTGRWGHARIRAALHVACP